MFSFSLMQLTNWPRVPRGLVATGLRKLLLVFVNVTHIWLRRILELYALFIQYMRNFYLRTKC